MQIARGFIFGYKNDPGMRKILKWHNQFIKEVMNSLTKIFNINQR
ncbi:hypothetical protein CU037_1257 [Enterococcus faecium]|nr:hypothetical protein [Enterococcus faecium]